MQSKIQPVASTSTSSTAGKPDRLYIGNLSPTVDEYTLIQIFSKYGKIVKLDFMFHKTGVLKGKPRGFAFIEMSSKDDALKALVKLHDRMLRGRKLVVTYASSAPPEDYPVHSNRGRRPTEPPKTTTLSLLKQKRRPQSAAAQIAAMEAKLASMAKRPGATSGEGDSNSSTFSPAYNGSLPGSPGVGGEVGSADEGEGLIGMEEGGKAAEDLEKEIEAELRAEENGGGPSSVVQDKAATPESQSPLPTSINPSLPPRPAMAYNGIQTIRSTKSDEEEERAKLRELAFKQGLAGLPKKPI